MVVFILYIGIIYLFLWLQVETFGEAIESVIPEIKNGRLERISSYPTIERPYLRKMFFSMLMITAMLKSSHGLTFSTINNFTKHLDPLWIQMALACDIALWVYLYYTYKCRNSTAFDRYIEVILPISIIFLAFMLGALQTQMLATIRDNNPNRPWYEWILWLIFESSTHCVFIRMMNVFNQVRPIRASGFFTRFNQTQTSVEVTLWYNVFSFTIFIIICVTYACRMGWLRSRWRLRSTENG